MTCRDCPESLVCMAGRLKYTSEMCPTCGLRYIISIPDRCEIPNCPRILDAPSARECDWCWAKQRFGPTDDEGRPIDEVR